jgi:hypothetical protein
MTPFEQDLLKILLDKLLLGVVAAGFGFYLARLLENYKNKKSYELFVWEQRVDACRSASRIITEHYFSVSEAFAGLKAAAEKGSMSMEDDNAKKLLAHAEKHPKLRNELIALTPFLVPHVTEAAVSYLNEAGRVSDLVRGKFDQGAPKQEQLSLAHSQFQAACAAVIDAGPHGALRR